MIQPAAVATQAVESLETTFLRARCVRPSLIELMVSSLSRQGQLTPVVAVMREGKREVIDGFKRLEATKRLDWPTLLVSTVVLDEMGQWGAMLSLNRAAQSMTELEEALVIRELMAQGLTQAAIGQVTARHKSWVSRRVGLVERLHPELVDSIRVGLLHPGVARRLLSLPPGNQLQLAAAAQSARLGPRDTELLVSLWQRAKEPEVKKQLLSHPALAVRTAFPEYTRAPVDSRLSRAGQQLSGLLSQVGTLASRATRMLPPPPPDLPLLSPMLAQTEQAAFLLASALGSSRSGASRSESDAADETSSSSP